MTPSTHLGKWLTILWSLVSIPLIFAVNIGVARGVSDAVVNDVRRRYITRVMLRPVDVTDVAVGRTIDAADVDRVEVISLVAVLVLSASVLLLTALTIAVTAHWSFMDAFYFCFLTASTIGLGHHTLPHKDWTASLALAVCVLTGFIAGYTLTGIAQRLLAKMFRKRPRSRSGSLSAPTPRRPTSALAEQAGFPADEVM